MVTGGFRYLIREYNFLLCIQSKKDDKKCSERFESGGFRMAGRGPLSENMTTEAEYNLEAARERKVWWRGFIGGAIFSIGLVVVFLVSHQLFLFGEMVD